MKKSYVQVGLVVLALSLYLMGIREGFAIISGTSVPKCPNGSSPSSFEHVCPDMTRPSTGVPVCPPGTTDPGNDALCQKLSTTGGPPTYSQKKCPANTTLALDMSRKCYHSLSACPSGTTFYAFAAGGGGFTNALCVPKTATTYATNLRFANRESPPSQEEITNACRPGDALVLPKSQTPVDNDFNFGEPLCLKASRDMTSADAENVRSAMRDVANSLNPFRPPTAPSSDLEKERKEIADAAKTNLFFIQAALFLVVLSMLTYAVLPLDTANMIAFGLLSVGIAIGFFLKG